MLQEAAVVAAECRWQVAHVMFDYFAYPWFLLLLPMALILGWRRMVQQRPAIRFSDFRMIAELPQGRSRIALRFDAALHAAALLALIIALSGPRLPMPTPVVTEGIAIELVVDASGSMRETDLNWNGAVISRFEAVQRAFRLFVLGGTAPDGAVFSGRSQDLIGLVTFATYPDSPAPLTLSHRVLADLLDAEQPRPLNEAQTNIGDALAEALVRLEEAGTRRKVIVLLTDGEHNFAGTDRAPSRTPRWAARRAADLGVAIYAIDAGSDAGGSTPEMRQAGRAALQEVASISGGGYFAVQDAAALLRVCHEIDRLETRPIVSPFRSPYRELHVPFGLAALCFILAAQAWNLMIGGQAR